MKIISIISHDAGGAEIISSWAKQQNRNFFYVLEGPALKIFTEKIKNLQIISLRKAIEISDIIICGTSWGSEIEKEALLKGNNKNIITIAFLDHWTNYRERFFYKGTLNLPSKIWVVDKYAFEIAKKKFPNTVIELKKNYYIENVKELFSKINTKIKIEKDSKKLLFTAENIREHALMQYGDEKHWGYSEEEALNYFLNNIEKIPIKIEAITIRPHPSDYKDKYLWTLNNNLVTAISNSKTLIQDISESDIIVGCESMAMIVALAVGKKVISCIPPKGKRCSLPHDEIINFADLIY